MRPHTPVVIGYHGCSRALAEKLVTGQDSLKARDHNYHWLGSGIYFWENDKDRALEWAVEKASRGELEDPCVIGAVVELGKCLDLSVRENVPLVRAAYDSLTAHYAKSGDAMPQNKKAPKDLREDKVLRFLDCAVLNHLVDIAGNQFDTVRGLFVEGGAVYDGAEIYNKTHVEIAVRNPSCIKGIFLPIG